VAFSLNSPLMPSPFAPWQLEHCFLYRVSPFARLPVGAVELAAELATELSTALLDDVGATDATLLEAIGVELTA
jgi:hypothetical protein